MSDALGYAIVFVLVSVWALAEFRNRRLRASNDHERDLFRLMIQFAPVGIGLTRLDGSFRIVNRAYAKILGRPQEEIEGGLSWREVTVDPDAKIDAGLATMVASGELGGYSMGKHYIRPDGSHVPVKLTVVGLWAAPGDWRDFLVFAEPLSPDELLPGVKTWGEIPSDTTRTHV